MLFYTHNIQILYIGKGKGHPAGRGGPRGSG